MMNIYLSTYSNARRKKKGRMLSEQEWERERMNGLNEKCNDQRCRGYVIYPAPMTCAYQLNTRHFLFLLVIILQNIFILIYIQSTFMIKWNVIWITIEWCTTWPLWNKKKEKKVNPWLHIYFFKNMDMDMMKRIFKSNWHDRKIKIHADYYLTVVMIFHLRQIASTTLTFIFLSFSLSKS